MRDVYPTSGITAVLGLMLGLSLGGCAVPAAVNLGGAALPPDAVVGAGDPLRAAVISTRSAFSGSQRLSAAEAARAIAQMEFLAVTLPDNPTLRNNPSTLRPQLDAARQEWRGVLGIPASAPAQPVINALYAAGRALDRGEGAAAGTALPTSLFTRGGPATLAQLAALPLLPRTAAAVATAQQTLVAPRPTDRSFF